MRKQDRVPYRQNWQDPAAAGLAALILLIAAGGFDNAKKVACHECPYIKSVYIGRIRFLKVAEISVPGRT